MRNLRTVLISVSIGLGLLASNNAFSDGDKKFQVSTYDAPQYKSDIAYQQTLQGDQDAFLFRFDVEGYLAAVSPDSSQSSSVTIVDTTSMQTETTLADSTPGLTLFSLISVFCIAGMNLKRRRR